MAETDNSTTSVTSTPFFIATYVDICNLYKPHPLSLSSLLHDISPYNPTYCRQFTTSLRGIPNRSKTPDKSSKVQRSTSDGANFNRYNSTTCHGVYKGVGLHLSICERKRNCWYFYSSTWCWNRLAFSCSRFSSRKFQGSVIGKCSIHLSNRTWSTALSTRETINIWLQRWLTEQTNRTEHFRGPVRFVRVRQIFEHWYPCSVRFGFCKFELRQAKSRVRCNMQRTNRYDIDGTNLHHVDDGQACQVLE